MMPVRPLVYGANRLLSRRLFCLWRRLGYRWIGCWDSGWEHTIRDDSCRSLPFASPRLAGLNQRCFGKPVSVPYSFRQPLTRIMGSLLGIRLEKFTADGGMYLLQRIKNVLPFKTGVSYYDRFSLLTGSIPSIPYS